MQLKQIKQKAGQVESKMWTKRLHLCTNGLTLSWPGAWCLGVGKGLWAEDWGAGGVLASYSPGRGVSEAGCLQPEVHACLGFADPADLQTLNVSCAHDLRLVL